MRIRSSPLVEVYYLSECILTIVVTHNRHGVGIIGFNSPEWFMADLAAVHAGGMAAGIYPTNSPEACK